MNTISPLRYPGGKAALAHVLSQMRDLNGLGRLDVAEPYAGGAGAALSMLLGEETRAILINDLDTAIYDFWWSILNRPRQFAAMVSAAQLTMTEWRKQRDAYLAARTGRLRRGFALFYLNRCNRSGIVMNGGPIGGTRQNGKWKLDARFNRQELQRRCARIFQYRDRIKLSADDGIDFINSVDSSETMFFIDPPYFHKGRTLYLNALDESYHANLAERLRSMSDAAWILTYDDCPEVRRLYRGWAKIRPFGLRYVASQRRSGRELLIVPRWMRLPTKQDSAALNW